MEQIVNTSSDDELIEKFQKEFTKIMFELRLKKQLLEECRSELNDSIVKQQELEHELGNEKRKNTNNDSNNILIRNANIAFESERQQLSKELSKYKSRNDMIIAERDSLYEETRVLALDNYKLKLTIKDLECKHQSHILFQSDITKQFEKLKTTLTTLMPTIKKLCKNQENILEINENMIKFENLKLAVKQAEKQKEFAESQRDFFENKFITESVECRQLHALFDNLFNNQSNHISKPAIYWKEKAALLETQLKYEKEKNETLESTLKLSIQNEIYSREILQQEQDVENTINQGQNEEDNATETQITEKI